MPVHLVDHPVVQDALVTLRDSADRGQTNSAAPRTASAWCSSPKLCATADAAVTVQTPLEPAPGRRLRDVVVVPVLRAGLGMLDAVLELVPSAHVGHIGLQRDETDGHRVAVLSKLPADLNQSFVLLVDPMLATGGSAVAALDGWRGPARATCACLHRRGARRHRGRRSRAPDVHIYTPAIDRELNAHKFILPGLGDFGDRLYGTPDMASELTKRSAAKAPPASWKTALTHIESNKVLVRGYPLDEMMGRVGFGEAIYLLLIGELPSPSIGRMIDAMLVSFIDHGATPPSTQVRETSRQRGRRCAPRRGGRPGLRQVPRRRRRGVHGPARRGPRPRARRQKLSGRGAGMVRRKSTPANACPASGIACTRTTPVP